ncbi:hypothetical protein SAMN05444722_3484 [Rhodovulum sp. ES.010]|nr:hypothetical protein SAMN05444722_3484 [Rhodovulum sp. ES.010]
MKTCLALSCDAAICFGGAAQAQRMSLGAFEYRNGCAACHGAEGDGNGRWRACWRSGRRPHGADGEKRRRVPGRKRLRDHRRNGGCPGAWHARHAGLGRALPGADRGRRPDHRPYTGATGRLCAHPHPGADRIPVLDPGELEGPRPAMSGFAPAAPGRPAGGRRPPRPPGIFPARRRPVTISDFFWPEISRGTSEGRGAEPPAPAPPSDRGLARAASGGTLPRRLPKDRPAPCRTF